jgi:hypothetical protein
VALRDGAPTAERGGRALMRTEHMPSRPMTLARDRRVAFSGAGAGGLAFDVTQKRGARKATGTLRIDDGGANVRFEANTFGVLQLADGWASFTGRGRLLPAGAERSATVIVDRADPLAADHATQIIVEIEGERSMSTRVAAAAVWIGR